MNDNLRACPFCGGRPTIARAAGKDWYRILCSTCKATRDEYTTLEGARTAWNRRALLRIGVEEAARIRAAIDLVPELTVQGDQAMIARKDLAVLMGARTAMDVVLAQIESGHEP